MTPPGQVVAFKPVVQGDPGTDVLQRKKGTIEGVNSAFTAMTGFSAAEAVGHSGRLLRSGRHDRAFYSMIWESVRRNGEWHGEVWNCRKGGDAFPAWVTLTAVQAQPSEVTRYVCRFLDIAQRKLREQEIEHLAFHDVVAEGIEAHAQVDLLARHGCQVFQ